MAQEDERTIELDGVRYTARVLGPAPWNKSLPEPEFGTSGPGPLDELMAEIVEFTGHPVPLRSRATSAIPLGTLHSMTDVDLAKKLRRALEGAQHPHGHDLVALTRGDQRLVLSWGDWNALVALLLMCGYDMQSHPRGPEICEQDATALHQLITQIQETGGDTAKMGLPQDLPDDFVDFLSGGTFTLVDID